MDFSFQVYDTCDVRQVCTLRNEEVCGDVTDLKCDIVAYTGTNPAQANKINRNVNRCTNDHLPN